MKDATKTSRNGTKVLPVTQPEVWFLLDRSGSMQSIASDVVGGFNRFFAEQRFQAGQLRVTVVQFDNEAPHEVLIDRADVASVVDLDAHRYKPRGMTPLFDAIDLLLDRAERAQGSPTDQLVVVFTDGLENASHRVSREWPLTPGGRSVPRRQPDSYAARRHGVARRGAPRDGREVAFSSISRCTSEWGESQLAASHRRRAYGGRKEAEETPRG